jgi:hypothetical protein
MSCVSVSEAQHDNTMNKSSFLLLPTVLAVSTSARAQRSSTEVARTQGTPGASSKSKNSSKDKRPVAVDGLRKSVSIDFVFNVNR